MRDIDPTTASTIKEPTQLSIVLEASGPTKRGIGPTTGTVRIDLYLRVQTETHAVSQVRCQATYRYRSLVSKFSPLSHVALSPWK
jgi:hypothetical protein